MKKVIEKASIKKIKHEAIKRQIIWVISLLLISVMIIIVYQNGQTITGRVAFTPTIPSDCSDSSIKALWDSAFTESSTGITILSNTTQTGKCEAYFAYKNSTNSINVLVGRDILNSTLNTTEFIALIGNFSAARIQALMGNISLGNINDVKSISPGVYNFFISDASPRNSSLNSSQDANSDYLLHLQPENGTWTEDSPSNSYIFTISSNMAVVSKDKYFDSFLFSRNGTITSCTPNWTDINTTCMSGDIKTTWFNDTKSCNQSPPGNITQDCDFEGNGIIGDFSSYARTNLEMDVYINSSLSNISKIYSGINNLEFREGNQTRVKLSYNFSVPLNMRNISIKKQGGSSRFGYLIVNGIERTKTLIVDRLSANYKICVKNAQVTEISEISESCNQTDEYIISCPGSNGSYSCSLSTSLFNVSGLTHSAVREIVPTATNCTQSWSCTNWTSCANGNQTRVCMDSNNCENNTGKPSLSQSCTAASLCSPSWNCTNWTSCVNGNQTRTCSDNTNCGSNTGKPSLSQSCAATTTSSSGISGFTVLILILAGLCVVVLVVVVYLAFGKKEEHSAIYVTQGTSNNDYRGF